MSRTYKHRPEHRAHSTRRERRNPEQSDSFRCRHCGLYAGPLRSGGHHRNHCPYCLHSLHVDGRRPGDRASDCRSRMAPVGVFTRPNGEQVLVHRCLGCGFERHNRIAGDDDVAAVMRLPLVAPRLGNVRRLDEECTA